MSINAEGKIYLQDDRARAAATSSTKLQAIAENKTDRRIFVRGDKGIAYGRIMEVMATITQGGFTKVALLAEQPAGAPGRRPRRARAAAPAGAARRLAPCSRPAPQRRPRLRLRLGRR